MTHSHDPLSAGELASALVHAREHTFTLVSDLTDAELLGPRLPILNPLLWEIGHLAWFQEKWVLRGGGDLPSIRADADRLYDSMAVPHDTRWDLPLPSREETLSYLREVRDRVLALLARRVPSTEEAYFVLLSVFHEDMHHEAFAYERQTLALPPPPGDSAGPPAGGAPEERAPLKGDAILPGGAFPLGASRREPFVFDNEKWEHPVKVRPFAIARAPATQHEYAGFVEEDGYRRPELWSAAGWRWRESSGAEHPLYWRREGGVWLRRDFDRWLPLEADRPVLHVSWYEAEAFSSWAGRRLPTEAEWEMAASWDHRSGRKLRFPWGDEPPTPARANLDWRSRGALEVGALPGGDSPAGLRQMIGSVWEWVQDDFGPYPGFVPDPYREYSQPWFRTHKVLRGGCWATRSRLIRSTWRNFYTPDRRDVWAGFRTCAAERRGR